MVSAARGADDPSLSNPMTRPMIQIECENGTVFEAYPACNAAPGCPKGLYWEMCIQGEDEPFDEYLTSDVFDLVREAVGPQV